MPSPRELIERCRKGDQAAAAELVHLWFDRLSSLAKEHIAHRLRGRIDPDEVANSALRTFFRRQKAGEFEFATDSDVFALLATIAVRKAQNQVRFHLADKRSAARDVRSSDPSPDFELFSVLADGPTRDQEFALVDLLDYLHEKLTDEQRTICGKLLEGYTQQEIAAELEVSERTVRRAVALIRMRLEMYRVE
jgi:DNA-directed RNA polymerase specialized sigma24 family protein